MLPSFSAPPLVKAQFVGATNVEIIQSLVAKALCSVNTPGEGGMSTRGLTPSYPVLPLCLLICCLDAGGPSHLASMVARAQAVPATKHPRLLESQWLMQLSILGC